MRRKAILWLMLSALMLAGCGRQAPTIEPDPTIEPTPTSEPAAGAAEPFFDWEAQSMDEPLPVISPGELSRRMAESDPQAVTLLVVNVGKGDALILRAGDSLVLIDTGKTRARGRVVQGLRLMGAGVDRLDGLFITHTDDDHTGGLRWLAPEAGGRVDAWYASAMFTGVKAGKHPLTQAARQAGREERWLKRGDAVELGGGAVLKVLAPNSLYEDKDDNNSLVMLLESDAGRILFTGDMELPEEAELLGLGDDLSCAVLKVPNHGDDDTTSAAFARACAAAVAVISTDELEKPGTPDPAVVSRLEAAGSRVVVTQDAELGVLITLKGGEATVESVAFGEPSVSGLAILEVDAGDDRVTLTNAGSEVVDLQGFYLYSDRGDELFAFPEGASIGPGGRLVVGTRSTEGAYDLLWDDKKVINRKKTDVIYLYDRWGRPVDRLESDG